jgi:hypothetical protein
MQSHIWRGCLFKDRRKGGQLVYTDNIRGGGKEEYRIGCLAMTTFHFGFMTEKGDEYGASFGLLVFEPSLDKKNCFE